MRFILPAVLALTVTSCSEPTVTESQKAPTQMLQQTADTPRDSHTDTYFGVTVADPYRWLEDDLSPETEDWIASQNTSTRSYIDAISLRQDVKETVANLELCKNGY